MKNNPEHVARFGAIFAGQSSETLITDLVAQVSAITIRGHAFPYTVSSSETAANCYLCSPTTAYIDYALDETRNLNQSRAVKYLTCAVIRACAPLVRASGLDHQVQINNWLVSTNPVPALSVLDAEAIKTTCCAQFADRAIVLRSLNDVSDDASISALKAVGFRMLAARQIYLLQKGADMSSRDAKRDAALVANTDLDVIEGAQFTAADFARCEDLYRALYLEKYTTLNPHYTASFFQQVHAAGLMRFVGLRHPRDGLIGFTGLFQSIGTLTQPFVGYDTARPASLGLYRMLMSLGRSHAITQDLDFNMSAGAAGFKRNRRAVPAIEYTAVYVAHLPAINRIATAIIAAASCGIGVPVVKRFEL